MSVTNNLADKYPWANLEAGKLQTKVQIWPAIRFGK